MKRILSICIMIMMLMSMMVPVSAAATTDGTITIENVLAGNTYHVHLMFELESYDKEDGAYSYVVTEDWVDFVNDNDDLFVVDEDGVAVGDYVVAAEGASGVAIAEKAHAYVSIFPKKK